MLGFLAAPVIKSLFGNVFGLIGDHFDAKRKRKQSKLDSELALAQIKIAHTQGMATAKQDHEINWDIIQAEGAKNSWKDEYLTIILSIPAILCFVPGMQDHVYNGFTALQQAPEWYLLAFGTMVAASFGMRNIVPHFKKAR